MLHEIILSLLGFTGNIIVRNREDTTFEVNNNHQQNQQNDEFAQQNSYGDVFGLLTEAEQVSSVLFNKLPLVEGCREMLILYEDDDGDNDDKKGNSFAACLTVCVSM